jgi:hypothetical protein
MNGSRGSDHGKAVERGVADDGNSDAVVRGVAASLAAARARGATDRANGVSE